MHRSQVRDDGIQGMHTHPNASEGMFIFHMDQEISVHTSGPFLGPQVEGQRMAKHSAKHDQILENSPDRITPGVFSSQDPHLSARPLPS